MFASWEAIAAAGTLMVDIRRPENGESMARKSSKLLDSAFGETARFGFRPTG